MADKTTKPRRDTYQDITDGIIRALEAGTPPWRRPWDPAVAAPMAPMNAASGRRYRGINTLLLGMAPQGFMDGDPRWCTYQQAQERGWQVRKGERGTGIVFFKPIQVGSRDETADDGGDAETKTIPMVRAYTVFHASQMDGIPEWRPPTIEDAPWRAPEAVRTVLDASGVPIITGGDRAFYAPSRDTICMPPEAAFRTAEGWAATALHELGHATGHPSRLDRNLAGRFGTKAYAMEELRAEIASAMVCAELGVPSELEQHASYVDSWLEVLRNDKREIFRAAADAQRAADWVLDRHPAYRLANSEPASDDRSTPSPVSAKMPKPDERAAPDMPTHVAAALPAHIRQRIGLPEPEEQVRPEAHEQPVYGPSGP